MTLPPRRMDPCYKCGGDHSEAYCPDFADDDFGYWSCYYREREEAELIEREMDKDTCGLDQGK